MFEPAVRVQGLGKRFRIGKEKLRHNTLRDALVHGARRSMNGIRAVMQGDGSAGGPEHFWALRGVDFEVAQGEAIGVIGANGAGKSTLLKILSRITEPTEGQVEIRGRIGSLLEVGTGFHSELTGRENTFLSGAILGMSRNEIQRKFDEIVTFAGIDRFIDTPVKHYSSGMYLRLAFAVAAHLEPDILLVDEVLAVGDADFQRKCLGKMEDVTRQDGRTVLFVSHNMTAIQRLCGRCILLRRGQVVASGTPREVVRSYLSAGKGESLPGTWIDLDCVDRKRDGGCGFAGLSFSSGSQATEFFPYTNGPLEVVLAIEADEEMEVESLGVTLYDTEGRKLVNADTSQLTEQLWLTAGTNRLELKIGSLHLNPGVYTLGLWLANHSGSVFDDIPSAVEIEVVGTPGQNRHQRRSDALVPCHFEVRRVGV